MKDQGSPKPNVRLAKRSVFSRCKDPHECAHSWPEDCFVQCGDRGIVFVKETSTTYETAFFEAFPRNPDTFLRGEGKTVEEAEEQAWTKYQKQLNCKKHEFERKHYRNGAGVCKNCGLFLADIFEPLEICQFCNKPTYFGKDTTGKWFCKECSGKVSGSLKRFATEDFL